MTSVLIVDYEKRWIKDIDRCLKNNGYATYYAKNASDALDDLERNPIDVIIADIMAPKMTGLTLLSLVNENYPDIPVILIADLDAEDTAKAAVKEDAFDYLIKPVSESALLKTVESALRQKGIVSNIPDNRIEWPAVSPEQNTLFDALNSTFHVIGRLLELKDPLSMGHERKVANLALSIARKMELSQEQQDCVYFASFLHDIGKLMIPSEILSKPSKLTPCEYAMVKDHVPRGYALIQHIKLPWPIQDVVYQHHERMDGSGYPEGLVGDEIMLEAKILAVADVIEAMTSYRPYRPRFDVRVALKEIKDNCGKLYDHAVCDAVYSLFRDDQYHLEDNALADRMAAGT